MLDKLRLGTVFVASVFAAAVACSANDAAAPDETPDSGAVEHDDASTHDAATAVDSATADTGAGSDSGKKPDAAAGCSSDQFWNGSTCKTCSGACEAGRGLPGRPAADRRLHGDDRPRVHQLHPDPQLHEHRLLERGGSGLQRVRARLLPLR